MANTNRTRKSHARRLLLAGILSGTLILISSSAGAAGDPEVAIPEFHDKYSAFVKQLESGQTDINYREFRESFLDSKQFAVAGSQVEQLGDLRQQLFKLMEQPDSAGLIRTAKKMLSIDYTDMLAHKILQQTYKIVGDEANRKKYHDIEFGLLNSIVKNGDGKSCKTAWPVVQIKEEYFILHMIGAKLKTQSVESTGGLCDRMEVTTDQGDAVFYFGVDKIFEQYNRLISNRTPLPKPAR